jgi:hypothetical protein
MFDRLQGLTLAEYVLLMDLSQQNSYFNYASLVSVLVDIFHKSSTFRDIESQWGQQTNAF